LDIKLLIKSSPRNIDKIYSTLSISLIAIVVYGLIAFSSNSSELINVIIKNTNAIFKVFLLIIIGLSVRFYRWKFIVKQLNLNIPLLGEIKSWLSSQAFLATPGGSGLAIRAILIKEKYGVPIKTLITPLIIERLSDLIAILLLMTLSFHFTPLSISNFIKTNLTANILIIIVLSLLTYVTLKSNRFLYKLFKKLFPKKFTESQYSAYLSKLLKNIYSKKLLISSLIGMVAWALEGIGLTIILKSYKIDNFNALWGIFTHSAGNLIGAISFLPGGLGTAEASMISILTFFKISLPLASASVLMIRLMTLWLASSIGFICLLLPTKK
tara:strand:+ start:770 stop:1747 length:978 start_codon:yes stop_codon:yes gene_type:complete